MRLIVFVLFRCFGILLLAVPLLVLATHAVNDRRVERTQQFERNGIDLPARVISKSDKKAFPFFRSSGPRYFLVLSFKDLGNRTAKIAVSRSEFDAAYLDKVLLTRVLVEDKLAVQYPIGSGSGYVDSPTSKWWQIACLVIFCTCMTATTFGAVVYARFFGEVRYVHFDKAKTLRSGNKRAYWRSQASGIHGATGPIPKDERFRLQEMEDGQPLRMYRLPGLGYLWWEHELPFKPYQRW
ncbi:hypothetical protein [Martelella sp. AD-3]|uniref:hypothetical protein n=1 Tax=Martelella sp. AD-3 TaxID=686597 RepID=UPI0004655399|nr:hypothetical protein [Martelella sp. AD-3]AMM84300.1 hypothetical protein AZF01_07940 [Martelella sp. AD-3]